RSGSAGKPSARRLRGPSTRRSSSSSPAADLYIFWTILSLRNTTVTSTGAMPGVPMISSAATPGLC
ncbi:hypothetical protein KL939_005402, partial [Ogataea angusta]